MAGSFRTGLLALLGIVCGCVSSGPAVADGDAGSACDRLAAGPEDSRRRASPVPSHLIDVPRALSYCKRAVEIEPRNPRLLYQYGRVLLAAGRNSDAIGIWRRAAAFDYPAALYELGRALFPSAADPLASMHAPEGYRLLARAADLGSVAAAELLAEAADEGRA